MRLSSLYHLWVSSQSKSVPLPSFHSFLAGAGGNQRESPLLTSYWYACLLEVKPQLFFSMPDISLQHFCISVLPKSLQIESDQCFAFLH